MPFSGFYIYTKPAKKNQKSSFFTCIFMSQTETFLDSLDCEMSRDVDHTYNKLKSVCLLLWLSTLWAYTTNNSILVLGSSWV